MKKVLIAACLFITYFSGCKKANDDISLSVIGTWEITYAQNGMTPAIYYNPGNGNVIIFTLTTYKIYTNGQLTKTGDYNIIKDNAPAAGECLNVPATKSFNRIIFNHDPNDSKIIDLTSDSTFIFRSGCPALDSRSFLIYEKSK